MGLIGQAGHTLLNSIGGDGARQRNYYAVASLPHFKKPAALARVAPYDAVYNFGTAALLGLPQFALPLPL